MRNHTDSTWCTVTLWLTSPLRLSVFCSQQLEISEESSKQSIGWLQLKAEPTVVITRVRQTCRRCWSLSRWQQQRKLSTQAEENWRASKTQLWDCAMLAGTILLCDKLLTELLVLTGYSLCSALGWSETEKTKVLYHPRQRIQKGHRIT